MKQRRGALRAGIGLAMSAALFVGIAGAAQARTGPAAPVFKTYSKPSEKYTDRSCAIDLKRQDDLESYDSVHGCGSVVVTFSVPLSRSLVDRDGTGDWPSWGAPPFTEDKTPYVLASGAATAVTLSYTDRIKIGGVEIQPAGEGLRTITADFYREADGGGKLAGTVTRTVNGDHGARLFAIKAGAAFDDKAGFYSVIITSDTPFAIAQLRV